MTHRFIILTFLFYCISSFYSYGQLRQIVISGTVIDNDSKTFLPYATVSAFDTEGVLVNGGIADVLQLDKLKVSAACCGCQLGLARRGAGAVAEFTHHKVFGGCQLPDQERCLREC